MTGTTHTPRRSPPAGLRKPKVVQADWHFRDEHVALCKQSEYTKDFSNALMFSGPEHYEKGWIRTLRHETKTVALTCVRHKSTRPETVLYFLVVAEHLRGLGLGTLMLEDMYTHSPHRLFKLNVMKANESALKFYQGCGWVVAGESLEGAAWAMEMRVP